MYFKGKNNQKYHRLIECIIIVIGALTVYWLFNTYIIATTITYGQSMAPSLYSGDACFLNKWIYYFRNPKQGDIIVIKIPGDNDLKVKRIIGVENDIVTIKNDHVFINNMLLQEPYLDKNAKTKGGFRKNQTYKIQPRHYFVLGDNREMSYDSRFFGSVNKDWIIGKISN